VKGEKALHYKRAAYHKLNYSATGPVSAPGRDTKKFLLRVKQTLQGVNRSLFRVTSRIRFEKNKTL